MSPKFFENRSLFPVFIISFVLLNLWNITPSKCDTTTCDTSKVQITRVTNKTILFGDGPFFDKATESVFFVNSFISQVYRYDIKTKNLYFVQIGIPGTDTVQFVFPIEGTTDQFFISILDKLAVIIWDGVSQNLKDKKIVNSLFDTFQFVDDVVFGANKVGAITAPASLPNFNNTSAFLKSIATVPSRLFILTPDNKAKIEANVGNLTFINGVAFSLNQSLLYIDDSVENKIFAYKYDSKTNTVGDRTLLYDNELGGLLDGLTLDMWGNLLAADNAAGEILYISTQKGEEGKLLCRIKLPALFVTKPAFGGNGTIYFTAYAPGSTGGGLYAITGVKGIPYLQQNMAPNSFAIQ